MITPSNACNLPKLSFWWNLPCWGLQHYGIPAVFTISVCLIEIIYGLFWQAKLWTVEHRIFLPRCIQLSFLGLLLLLLLLQMWSSNERGREISPPE